MVLFRRLLGDVLRDRRMQRGMTLREVSAEARVSLGYISEIERGQKEASSELLASLCTALDVPLSDVLREVSDAVAVEEAAAAAATPITGRLAPPRRRGRRLRRLSQRSASGRLAGRAPVRRPLAARRAQHLDPDRRPAAPAAAARRAGRPRAARRSRRSPVVVWSDRSLFWSSIWCARRTSRGRSGTSPTGVQRVDAAGEAELGGVHVADPGQAGLVEQRLVDGAVRVGEQPAERLVLVPVGAEQVGAEVADDVVLAVAGEQLDDAEREADRRAGRRWRARPGPGGRAGASAAPGW